MRVLILLCLIAYVQSNPSCDDVDGGVLNCHDCTAVYQNQFKDCTALVTFNGPNVEIIYGAAFENSGLQHFDFSSLQTIYWNAFKNANLQGDISLPNVDGMIPNYAFANNPGLTSVSYTHLRAHET